MRHEWVHFPNSDRLGSDLRIFTHDMFGNYYGPFSFDLTDNGDAVVDDPKSPNFNVEDYAQRLMGEAHNRLTCGRSGEHVFI